MDIIQALKSTDNLMIVEHLIALFYQMYPNMKFLIDAGANQGFHFSRMNKLPHLNLCVAVEANPDHIARLEKAKYTIARDIFLKCCKHLDYN